MKTSHSKDSFLSIAEILNGAAGHCRQSEEELRSWLPKIEEPYSHALEEMAGREQELAAVIARFADKGPRNLLETRSQYTLDSVETIKTRDALEPLLREVQALGRNISMIRVTMQDG